MFGKLIGFIIGWNIGRSDTQKAYDKQLYNSLPVKLFRWTLYIATIMLVVRLFG